MFFLRVFSSKSLIFTPSKVISPLIGSNTLVSRLNKVDLPWPDLPTIAIFLLGSNFKLKFLSITLSFGYPKVTFLNSTIPLTFFKDIFPYFSSSNFLFNKISLILPTATNTFW